MTADTLSSDAGTDFTYAIFDSFSWQAAGRTVYRVRDEQQPACGIMRVAAVDNEGSRCASTSGELADQEELAIDQKDYL
jgi:hypothetical protein